MIVHDEARIESTSSLAMHRCEPGHPSNLILCSSKPIWVDTHWLGRQLMCCGSDCPACDRQHVREHGYLVALVEQRGKPKPVLLEIPPSCWSRLTLLARMEGFEPNAGTKVEASRKAKNKPLRLEPISSGNDVPDPLKDPELRLRAIALIHGISPPTPGENIARWIARTHEGRRQLLLKAM